MKKHRKAIQYAILACVLLIGGYAIGQSLFEEKTVLKIGSETPSFRLLGLDGETHGLEEYAGQPLVLNFWGTFCPPCREEMPAIQAQYEKWAERGVQVVGINLSEDRISVENYVRSVGARFPILLDDKKKTEKKFGLREYPTTYFISPDGEIRDIVVGGPLSEADIEARIERLLTES